MGNTNMSHPIAIGKQRFVSFEDYKRYQETLMSHRENADQVMANAKNSAACARREPANKEVAALPSRQELAAAEQANRIAAYAARSHDTPEREPAPDSVHIIATETFPRNFETVIILRFVGAHAKRFSYPHLFTLEGLINILEIYRAKTPDARYTLTMTKGENCP